jgi:energy-coupling factor transport system permease protein
LQNRDTFSGYHPIINFLYFGLVLMFTMFFMHPLCLGISLVSALTYSVYLRGDKALRFSLLYMLLMMLIAAIINPAFNHEGATILTYLPSDNPLTLESITYGIAAAVMLASVMVWFTCYNEVMTSDKFVYLFGRIIPALSLVLSMTLRFVPKFTAQIKVVRDAQRCIGRDVSEGSIFQRAKNGLTILSIMITWSLENAIETADSMKSRGYGLPGRTAFSIYRFDSRDRTALMWLLFCGMYIVSGWIAGGLYWRYYPTMKGVPISPFPISFMLAYLALCLTPVILNLASDRNWRSIRENTERGRSRA